MLNYENAKVGLRISASDGTKRPPDRFNKKLSAWKDSNFTGTIVDLEKPCGLYPNGGLSVSRDDFPPRGGVIEFKFSFNFGGRIAFTELAE